MSKQNGVPDKAQTVYIEIDGEEKPVLLCVWGLALAESKGFDLSGVALDEEEAEEQKGDINQMLDMLWIGRLPYDESVTRRELGMSIGLGDLPALTEKFQEIVDKQLNEDIREKAEEMANRGSSGGAEGKEA